MGAVGDRLSAHAQSTRCMNRSCSDRLPQPEELPDTAKNFVPDPALQFNASGNYATSLSQKVGHARAPFPPEMAFAYLSTNAVY